MSIEAIPLASRLQMRLFLGYEEGNPVIRTRTYSNIKPIADNEDVFAVAQQLAGLQIHELEMVRRVDEVDLVEVE